jgi:hypothetical protein
MLQRRRQSCILNYSLCFRKIQVHEPSNLIICSHVIADIVSLLKECTSASLVQRVETFEKLEVAALVALAVGGILPIMARAVTVAVPTVARNRAGAAKYQATHLVVQKKGTGSLFM